MLLPPHAPGCMGKALRVLITSKRCACGVTSPIWDRRSVQRAAASTSQMETATRQKYSADGGDCFAGNGGAERILAILEDYFASDAVDLVYREAARLMRADQTTAGFRVEFDMLRRRAKSGMQTGGGVPEAFASVWFRRACAARARGIIFIGQRARTIRRLSGPSGGAARRDVLVVADADSYSGGREDEASGRHEKEDRGGVADGQR